MEQEFKITYEDYKNSSKMFLDIYNCPEAVAARRQLGEVLNVGPTVIHLAKGGLWFLKDIFGKPQYDELVKGKEFTTTITLYEGTD